MFKKLVIITLSVFFIAFNVHAGSGGELELKKNEAKTFSGIAIYRKIFFDEISANTFLKLAPFLNKAIEKKLITGGLLNSRWVDVGTPERLNSLNEL